MFLLNYLIVRNNGYNWSYIPDFFSNIPFKIGFIPEILKRTIFCFKDIVFYTLEGRKFMKNKKNALM